MIFFPMTQTLNGGLRSIAPPTVARAFSLLLFVMTVHLVRVCFLSSRSPEISGSLPSLLTLIYSDGAKIELRQDFTF